MFFFLLKFCLKNQMDKDVFFLIYKNLYLSVLIYKKVIINSKALKKCVKTALEKRSQKISKNDTRYSCTSMCKMWGYTFIFVEMKNNFCGCHQVICLLVINFIFCYVIFKEGQHVNRLLQCCVMCILKKSLNTRCRCTRVILWMHGE